MLADPANTLLLSVVSAWELVLKTQTGKLRLPESPSVYVPDAHGHYAMEALAGDDSPMYWHRSRCRLIIAIRSTGCSSPRRRSREYQS